MKRGKAASKPIYLDYQATTPVDKRVLAAMEPVFTKDFGNAASSGHAFGAKAAALVEEARAKIAAFIGADPEEIVFTSGATESNNLALKGAATVYGASDRHIVTCVTEHRSVLGPLRRLAEAGFEVAELDVDREGLLRPDAVGEAIRADTILVSVMTANNEIGVLQPVGEIAAIAKRKGALFHTDATQAVGKIPFDVKKIGADLVSFSAHKIYGPKGVGALFVRRKGPHVRLAPQIDGGGHERGLRSGTLNVPGIVGFGKACEIAAKELKQESARIGRLRDRLAKGILSRLDSVRVNGSLRSRLPHNLSLSFGWVESESLLKRLDGIAVSQAAACASANLEPSHVLRALGVPEDFIHTSLRFSLGRYTTEAEIDEVIERVTAAAKAVRALSPLYAMARRGEFSGAVEWSGA